MMNWEAARRRRVWFSTAASALVLSAAMPAAAQSVANDQDGLEDIEVEEMVVTGSRLRRTGFEDITQPTLILDSELIEARGFFDVGDALNQIPGFGAPGSDRLGGSGSQVGAQFVNLFELGSARTLTVVNGRRFVTGNTPATDGQALAGLQVDLNNIPTIMVDRIENVSVGGAPIYGADAIAGTVNIILKDDFEGFQADFQYGDSIRFGDIDSYRARGLAGANFADGRGNVMAAVEYFQQGGATATARPLIDDAPDDIAAGGAEVGVFPDTRFAVLSDNGLPVGGPEANLLTSGTPFGPSSAFFGTPIPFFGIGIVDPNNTDQFLQFSPTGNGTLVPFDPGLQVDGSSAFTGQGGDGFDLEQFQEAIAPIERFVFYSQAKFDITDTLSTFFEYSYLTSSSEDLVNQAGTAFQASFLGLPSLGALEIGLDNPFLDPTAVDILQANGVTETFFVNRSGQDFFGGANNNTRDVDTFRVVGGIEGDFQAFERNFFYEVSYNFGRTESVASQQEIIDSAVVNGINSVELDATSLAQLQSNFAPNTDLFPATGDSLITAVTTLDTIAAIRNGEVVQINADTAQIGDIVCNVFIDVPEPVALGTVSEPPFAPNIGVDGCTPINPFGEGVIAPEAVAFITADAVSTGTSIQQDLLAVFGGDVFELPAGMVSMVLGFERRREGTSFEPGGVLEQGLSREPAIPSLPLFETLSTEFFGEIRIPVIDDDIADSINSLWGGFPVINALEVEAAARTINQNFAGRNTVWTAGGTLQIFNDFTIRGNYTRSIRAPSAIQLAQPPVPVLDQTGDPCDRDLITQGTQVDNRQQNCLTAALNAGFSDATLGEGSDGIFGLLLQGGVPGEIAFDTPTVNGAIQGFSAGNLDLSNEIANSFTGGFVWQPSYVPGLTIAADYVQIFLTDAITTQTPDFFTENCFDSAPSTFAAGGEDGACGFFSRGPSFDISTFQQTVINSDFLQFQGLIGNFRYEWEMADAVNLIGGLFGFNDRAGDYGSASLTATFFAEFLQIEGLDLDIAQNNVGTTADPELTAQINFNYQWRDLTFLWQTLYVDNTTAFNPRVEATFDDCTPNLTCVNERDLEFNATIGYQITDNFYIQGVVNDVFNNEPTLAQTVNFATQFPALTGSGNFLGRTFNVMLQARF